MRIALIGADGQLGSDLVLELKAKQIDYVPLYYPQFDITQPKEAKRSLDEIKPSIVINTAAYHRVDECEEFPQKAFEVNALAVRELALICRELGATLVHFSTDYVFDGRQRKPYTEEDCPRPLSVYAASKLAGEYFVQALLEKYFLIRTCGLYGVAGCWGKGTNFVETMLKLAQQGRLIRVVNDQYVTPTSTSELAARIVELLSTQAYGLYHLTNEGACTWFEFAAKIFELVGLQPQLMPVSSKEYGARAVRPLYSVLENKRAAEIGLTPFSPWEKALEDYLIRKGYLSTNKRS